MSEQAANANVIYAKNQCIEYRVLYQKGRIGRILIVAFTKLKIPVERNMVCLYRL